MKNLYSSPVVEILALAKEDILVTSADEKYDNIVRDDFYLLGGDGM